MEPFGGGASVLLRKPRSYAEVYNDLWGDITNVFKILRDRPDEFTRAVYLTPFSRAEFECSSESSADPLERARRTVYRSMGGFGSASVNGEHATGFRANSNRSGTTPAQDWRNYPDHVRSFADRLRGVIIECRNAIDVMKQHDSPETLHYVDPPYVRATRNMKRGNAAYQIELTDDDHVELSSCIRSLTGMVVLSGYRCALYDQLFADWRRVDRAALADGAARRVESLWLNSAASSFGQQSLLFTEG